MNSGAIIVVILTTILGIGVIVGSVFLVRHIYQKNKAKKAIPDPLADFFSVEEESITKIIASDKLVITRVDDGFAFKIDKGQEVTIKKE